MLVSGEAAWLWRNRPFAAPCCLMLRVAQQDLFVTHLRNFLPDKADFTNKGPKVLCFGYDTTYFFLHSSIQVFFERLQSGNCENVLFTYDLGLVFVVSLSVSVFQLKIKRRRINMTRNWRVQVSTSRAAWTSATLNLLHYLSQAGFLIKKMKTSVSQEKGHLPG